MPSEQGNAQMEARAAPLGEQEGAGSGVTPAGDSYNVDEKPRREGAEEGGIPQAEEITNQRRREPTGIMTEGAASREEFMRRYQLLGASKLLEGHTELGAWSAQMMKENPAIPKGRLA